MGDIAAKISYLTFTGGTGGIEANLPTMSFEGDSEFPSDITGTIPFPLFEGVLGYEVFVAGNLPIATGEVTGGGLIDQSLPALAFDGEIRLEVRADITGKLPIATLLGEWGGELAGRLPTPGLDATMTALLGADIGEIAGTLPAVISDISSVILSDSGHLSGILPFPTFDGTGTQDIIGQIAGTISALRGSFAEERLNQGNIVAKLPALSCAGEMLGDPYFDIAGTLPTLVGLGATWIIPASVIAEGTAALDANLDEIIRFRRGYDNG